MAFSGCGAPQKPTSKIYDAAREGNMEQIEAHIFHKSNLNEPSPGGMSPLAYAIVFGHPDIFEKLVGAGAKTDAVDANGWNLLHFAAANGQFEAAKLLLEKGVPLNDRTKDNKVTAYQLAVTYRNQKIADLLKSKGADTSLVHIPPQDRTGKMTGR